MTNDTTSNLSSIGPCSSMETYFGYIKCTQDALLIFKACHIGVLPRVTRRLSDRERSSIRSGSIFVWYEREAGMRRWTDGRSWSPSRVSGSFLTYKELHCKQKKGFSQPAQIIFKENGLIKQSFSITTQPNEKIHMISYYSEADLANSKLPCPTEDRRLEKTVKLTSPNQCQTPFYDRNYVTSSLILPPSLRSIQQWQSAVATNILQCSEDDDRGSCDNSITTPPSLIYSPDCNSVSTTSQEEHQDLPTNLSSCLLEKADTKCGQMPVCTPFKIQLPPISPSKEVLSNHNKNASSFRVSGVCSEDARQLKALSQLLRL